MVGDRTSGDGEMEAESCCPSPSAELQAAAVGEPRAGSQRKAGGAAPLLLAAGLVLACRLREAGTARPIAAAVPVSPPSLTCSN